MLRTNSLGFLGVTGLAVLGPHASKTEVTKEEEVDKEAERLRESSVKK